MATYEVVKHNGQTYVRLELGDSLYEFDCHEVKLLRAWTARRERGGKSEYLGAVPSHYGSVSHARYDSVSAVVRAAAQWLEQDYANTFEVEFVKADLRSLLSAVEQDLQINDAALSHLTVEASPSS